MNPRRVLVVDDEPDCADSLAELVGILGHEAKVAYDGQSALRIAEQFPPSHVLLDLSMPGMDGYTVARQLRASGVACQVIAVTGHGLERDRERCLAEGFDFYILKPAAPSDIAMLLGRIPTLDGAGS
jgi:two-component system, sensor histidine kinase